MSSKLGPIEVCCDCPPYPIVRGCNQIGISAPEDVRWFRLSRFLAEHHGWRGLFKVDAWKSFLGMQRQDRKACTCGQELPGLEKYTFTYLSGKEESYFLAQCSRCRTIFWEDA